MSQVVARTMDEVLARIGSAHKSISIDGARWVGKSTLASKLAERLGANWINTDAFLPFDTKRRDEAYVSKLNYTAIRSVIDEVRSRNRTLIIDGVCSRAVLARIPLVAEIHIYVKSVSSDGSWGDETMCDVNRIQEADEHGLDDGLDRLDREIRDYHREYDPLGNADVIFIRTKEN